jgi:hypothetical protein
MKAFYASLFEKVKGHPVAMVLAGIGLAVWGGGSTLSDTQIEPWGTLLQGLGALIGVIAGAIVTLAKKKEPPQ